ncbi:MAG: hypothetical protein NC389_16245 [Acetatifactor muris]|nr:hypothetical protein [Acetatifactor muris]
MKRIYMVLLCILFALSASACGNGQQSSGTDTNPPSQPEADSKPQASSEEEQSAPDYAGEGKVLVAYFAYSENMGDTSGMSVDAVTSASLNRDTDNTEGNLQVMAQEISGRNGAEVFSILLEEPFDPDYSTMLDGSIEQIQNAALPSLQSKVENMEQYDVVFLGLPVWSGEIPPAVRTFLTENDLSGKTVVPFGIHLGSGFGKMPGQIEELCPGADILDGFTINAGTANEEVRTQVNEWLNTVEIP